MGTRGSIWTVCPGAPQTQEFCLYELVMKKSLNCISWEDLIWSLLVCVCGEGGGRDVEIYV